MTAHVQSAGNGNGPETSQAVTIATTGGNLLVVTVNCYSTTSPGRTIASVTDSTAGTNVWYYSTAASSANPPVATVYDSASGNYATTAVAWSLTTAAVSSVTVTMSGSAETWFWVDVEEFSGVFTGYQASGVADTTDYTAVTSWTSEAITAPASAAVVICGGTITSFTAANTAGFTLSSVANGATYSAWSVPGSDGSFSCNFTQASAKVAGSVLFAYGLNAPAVTTTSLPEAIENDAYSATLQATGGTTP